MSLWYVFTYRLNLARTDVGNYPPTPPLKHNFTCKWELNVRVCCKRDLILNFSSNCRYSWLNVYVVYRTRGKYYLSKGKLVLGLHKSEMEGRGGGGGICRKLCIPVTSDDFTNLPTRAVCQAMETQQITMKIFLLLL